MKRLSRADEEVVAGIARRIGETFRCFGGGKVRSQDNPIAHALKNGPMQFAAGVDVEAVVRFVITTLREGL